MGESLRAADRRTMGGVRGLCCAEADFECVAREAGEAGKLKASSRALVAAEESWACLLLR